MDLRVSQAYNGLSVIAEVF